MKTEDEYFAEMAEKDRKHAEKLRSAITMFIQSFPDLNPANFGLSENMDWEYFHGATQAMRLLLRRFFSWDRTNANTIELLEDGRIFYAGQETVADGVAAEIALFTGLLKSEPGYEIVGEKVFRKPVEFKEGGKATALCLVRWMVHLLFRHPRFFRNFAARPGERDNMRSVILTHLPKDGGVDSPNINWAVTTQN